MVFRHRGVFFILLFWKIPARIDEKGVNFPLPIPEYLQNKTPHFWGVFAGQEKMAHDFCLVID